MTALTPTLSACIQLIRVLLVFKGSTANQYEQIYSGNWFNVFFFLLNIHKFNVWICGRTDLLQFFVTAVSSMNNSGKYFDIHFALPLYLLLLPSRVLMVFALSFIVQNAYYQIEILLLMIDFFFLASEGFFINLSFNLMLSDYMYQ